MRIKCLLPELAKNKARCRGRDCSMCGWEMHVMMKRNERIHNGDMVEDEGVKRLCVKAEPHFEKIYRLDPEEHEERLQLYNAGMTDSEIADCVGSSREAITSWRAKRGLPVHKKRKVGNNG